MNSTDLISFKNKTAVVTGCSRGIGNAIAVKLAEAGANIIGISASLAESGSEVEASVLATGREFAGHSCDFRSREDLYELLESIKSNHSKIDILVNNAGSIYREDAETHKDEDWDRIIAINQTAAFILSRELGKLMLKHKAGKIINIASLLSFQGGIRVPGYAASKGAIVQLTKALANEWASRGVNVNAVAPGYIQTDNTAELFNDPVRQNEILSRIPAGRWGQPEDIAAAVLFLASTLADYIHGTVLVVDGGWMSR